MRTTATTIALVLLAGVPWATSNDSKPASETARIDRAMTYIAEFNQNVAFSGLSGTDQTSEKQRESIGRFPTLPYLLVGVRDRKGYRGYVSPGQGAAPASAAVNVGSSTKSFTAALILRLDQDGTLSLNDTLADPRWRDVIRWPNGENITLRMVLAHTAGIPDYEDSKEFAERKLDPDWNPSPQDVIGFARLLKPTFKPDAGWAYSNTGYQILGLVIEAVTGNSYADELNRRFFQPLGLKHTDLYGHQRGVEPQTGYFLWCDGVPAPEPSSTVAVKRASEAACEEKKKPAYLPMTAYYANNEYKLAWSDGGIVSTPEDMTSWMTKLIATNEILDEPHRRLMQQATPQSVVALAKNTKNPPAVRRCWTGYGLGLQIYRYDSGPAFGHGGNIEGFSSNCVYLPGHGNDFAIEIIAPLFQADSAFDSSNRIADAVRVASGRGQRADAQSPLKIPIRPVSLIQNLTRDR